MQNIFLIGNGFDLSHNMNTGYKHFVDYIFTSFYNEYCNEISNRKIIDINIKNPFIIFQLNFKGGTNNYHYENQKYYQDIIDKLSKVTGYESFRKILDQIKIEYDLDIKNNYDNNIIFENIIKEFEKNKNWVDIERLYFRLLISERNTEELNTDFNILKDEFEIYLKSLNPTKTINQYKDFFSHFQAKDFNLILNFNYTDTFKQYLPTNFEIINIHGELKNQNNKIIFGYGDYESDEYKTIESLDENKKLKNIKLFDYSQTDNYEKLTHKLGEDFDVHILGHSCGLSDRGLLREIMNRKECLNIYIYYYEYEVSGKIEDDFIDKVQNLSRCFDNKQDFIRKVRHKNPNYKMFQTDK